jgi:hypothetical protein
MTYRRLTGKYFFELRVVLFVLCQAMSNDTKWRRICSDVLNAVWKNRDAWIFHAPVIESPELTEEAKQAYIQFTPHPMDLRTIRQSIATYTSPAEFESNMTLVFSNCARFNKPGQDAYEMGKDVEKFFNAKWADKRETAFELFRGSTTSETLIETGPVWRGIIRRVFDTIKNDPNFSWFQLPVHQYPGIDISVKKQYYSLIRSPMDFSTIEKNIALYPSPGELRRDLELIVTNSVRFNPPESVVNLAARQLQEKINELFDTHLAPFKNLPGDWNKAGVKRILPDPPGDEIFPPQGPPQVVVRLKRAKVEESTVTASAPPSESVTTPKQTSILLIDRDMAPVVSSSDWKTFALHLLNELGQIRDDSSSSKLSWIFQKPIFKYELPNQIKRLYLLSVTDLVDLQIIQQKLERGVYDSPHEFEHDVRVMLDNCLAFNDETQYPHKVGFVMDKHYKKYWYDCGLRQKAIGAWEMTRSLDKGGVRPLVPENPNWEEIRNLASLEAVKPGLDCQHISATVPLNDELLYEWRVAQRFVMQDRRNKMRGV